MNIEERKRIFRYLLKSIFYDDCQEIEDDRIADFYGYLLDSLEMQSDNCISNDNNLYFIVESMIQAISHFHEMDSSMLLYIIKHHDNFKEVVAEQTSLSTEFIDSSMEIMISNFQDIKQGYMYCS